MVGQTRRRQKRRKPDPKPNRALVAARLNAPDNDAFIRAVADLEWRYDYSDEDCPADMRPDERTLAEWLGAAPAEARAEAGRILAETLAGDLADWEDTAERLRPMYRYQPGDPVVDPLFNPNRAVSPPGVHWIAVTPAAKDARELRAALIVSGGFQRVLALSYVIAVWRAMQAAGETPDPLGPLVAAWQARARTDGARRVDYVEGMGGLRMSKIPALSQVTAAPLEIAGDVFTVESEGEPFLSPGPVQVRHYRPLRTQGQINAFPVTIDGRATGGAIVEALAEARLTGDERTTLRSDLRFLAEGAFALTGPIQMTAHELIALYAWPGVPADHVDRLSTILKFARHLNVDLGDRLPHWLFDVRDLRGAGRGLDTVYHIGPGGWWQGGSAFGDVNAWRLSGGLWRRPAIIEHKGPGGTMPLGFWGLPDRIIAGIEAALQWGPSPGKGRRGRIPEALRPIRKGGPGPERFIPNWHVLRLAGEAVTQEDYRTDSAPRRRYMRAVKALVALGYVCGGSGRPAGAGQTIEITRIISGRGRGRQGGLMVRATARFCDAYEKGQRGRGEWSSAPLVDVIANRNPDAR